MIRRLRLVWPVLGVLAVPFLIGAAAGAAEVQDWWAPGSDRVVPAVIDYEDGSGMIRTLNTSGPINTKGHPFFEPLGPNGRACVTCHQPADGMSISTPTINARWDATGGKDPLFAATDGSDCPSLPQDQKASHSLLLTRGLFRVARPWPPRNADGSAMTPEISIKVIHDPTGCNTSAVYGLNSPDPHVSVYRRPRPVSNLKYLLAVGFSTDPKAGMPLPLDPLTGQLQNGNLMADARVRTLADQAMDAGSTHLQMVAKMPKADLDRIIAFESGLYTAQYADDKGGQLGSNGAQGGPALLRDSMPGRLSQYGNGIWSEYDAWDAADNGGTTPDQKAFRASVARGAKIFRDRTFLISDSSGITWPIGFGNPVRQSCAFCHNMSQMGNDVAPGQVDLGTTNQPFANPSPELPLFQVTCLKAPHPYLGKVIYTQDPGYALTTGKCGDVGKITLQSLRGLAARPPYFSNGSAKTLREVIDFYDRRYNIHFTEQEKTDLVNLMSVL